MKHSLAEDFKGLAKVLLQRIHLSSWYDFTDRCGTSYKVDDKSYFNTVNLPCLPTVHI